MEGLVRQGSRWIRAGIALVMLAGGCAWAWAQGAADLPGQLPGWIDRLAAPSPSGRAWLLIPAGLLAMAFTASRTARSHRA